MKRKVIVIIGEVICLLLIVSVLVYNVFNGIKNGTIGEFLNANLAQLITPLIALVIAFWATQYKNDQRKAKEHAERIIVSIQEIVSSDTFSVFPNDGNETDIRRESSARNRKISNYLQILQEYSTELNFVEEYKYLDEKFTEYKTKVGEHISNLEYLAETEAEFKRLADNIDSKCESIILKFYK